MQTNSLLILMALLLFKHWLADFPWQSQWMVRNKADWTNRPALLTHCFVHALCSFAVLLPWFACYSPAWWSKPMSMWGLCAIEGAVHFAVDALKCHPKLGARWPLPHPRFWTMLGLDQLAHHLTYIAMAWLIITLGECR